MITYIDALPSGNAVRLILEPPSGCTRLVVLRRTADTFTGPTDPGALVVGDGDLHVVFDKDALVNGTQYFYKAYAWVAGAWVAGTTRSCTPDATYVDASDYPLLILRERLDEGLKVELSRKVLQHVNGAVPVLLSSPTFEDAKWPIVTLQMADSDSSAERFIGDFETDELDESTGLWSAEEGWLSSVQITVVGWSLNADARRTLRKSIARVIQSNLLLLEGLGLYNVNIKQNDQDDFSSYPAPVYQTFTTFTCLADESVMAQVATISDVTVTASPTN